MSGARCCTACGGHRSAPGVVAGGAVRSRAGRRPEMTGRDRREGAWVCRRPCRGVPAPSGWFLAASAYHLRAEGLTSTPARASSAGMGLERRQVKAVDEVWRRADAHTRSAMGCHPLSCATTRPRSCTVTSVTPRALNLTEVHTGRARRWRWPDGPHAQKGVLVRRCPSPVHSLSDRAALAALRECSSPRGDLVFSAVQRCTRSAREMAVRASSQPVRRRRAVEGVDSIAQASG